MAPPPEAEDAAEQQPERRYGKNGDLTLREFQDQIDSKPRTMFISGYEDLTEDEFVTHYHPELDRSIARGDTFIMALKQGPAEVMALSYLASKHVAADRIILYRLTSAENASIDIAANYPIKHITATQEDRDIALTDDSHGDIVWLRSGDEKSNWGFSATQCLNSKFDVPVKENARRRAARGIEAFMAAYDAVV